MYVCACVSFMCVCKNIYVLRVIACEFYLCIVCVCVHEVTRFYTWPLIFGDVHLTT